MTEADKLKIEVIGQSIEVLKKRIEELNTEAERLYSWKCEIEEKHKEPTTEEKLKAKIKEIQPLGWYPRTRKPIKEEPLFGFAEDFREATNHLHESINNAYLKGLDDGKKYYK